jgi:phage/plasmid-like protein (TIGR03299 family)
MGHMIERHADGTASFVSARRHAWHALGTVTESALTAQEAMDAAFLSGWNVRKLPLSAAEITQGGVTSLEVPEQFATARTHPKTGRTDILGVVGDRYEPVQNEQHCELLNTLVDQSGAHFETAGSLRGGREVFVSMKLPSTMRIAGTDAVDLYVVGANSHDGSSAFRLMVTPVRVVCANTVAYGLKKARSTYSIRHTAGAQGKIAEARKALGMTFAYCEQFERAAERMINEALSLGQFEALCAQLWPLDEQPTARTKSNHDRRMSRLRYLYRDAATNANIRGTRWAGVQAVGEYLDHFAPAKNSTVRAARVVASSEVAALKQKAFDLLTV